MDKLEYVVQVKEIVVKINPGLAVGNAGLRNKELSKRWISLYHKVSEADDGCLIKIIVAIEVIVMVISSNRSTIGWKCVVEQTRRPLVVGRVVPCSTHSRHEVHSHLNWVCGSREGRGMRGNHVCSTPSFASSLEGDCMSFLSWASAQCFSTLVKKSDAREEGGQNIVIPLLCPEMGVPFAACIELHGVCGLETGSNNHSVDRMTVKIPENKASVEHDMYELRFVLHGRGEMERHCDGDETEHVSPGDAILCKYGSVSYRNKSIDSQIYTSCSGMSWGMATFVVYIPRALVNTLDDDGAFEQARAACIEFMSKYEWPNNDSMIPVTDLLSSDDVDVLLRGAQNLGVNSQGHHVDDQASPSDWFVFHAQNIMSKVRRMLSHGEGERSPTEILKRTLADVSTFLLPNQTNRLALLFDPFASIPIPFVFGVEIFEPGHRTKPHVHSKAYEMFFILQGTGEGFCQGSRFPIAPGDVVAFQPGSTHGIDNGPRERMYCIEVMLPDENFAEFVRSGPLKRLEDDDLCILTRVGCS